MERRPLNDENLSEPIAELLDVDEEEEKTKKKKLAWLLALLATKKKLYKDDGKKSFVEEIVNQQDLVKDRQKAESEEKRLSGLSDEKIEEVAKEYVDDRLHAARKELEHVPPASVEETKALQDIDLLINLKELLESIPEEPIQEEGDKEESTNPKEHFGGVVIEGRVRPTAKQEYADRSSSGNAAQSASRTPVSPHTTAHHPAATPVGHTTRSVPARTHIFAPIKPVPSHKVPLSHSPKPRPVQARPAPQAAPTTHSNRAPGRQAEISAATLPIAAAYAETRSEAPRPTMTDPRPIELFSPSPLNQRTEIKRPIIPVTPGFARKARQPSANLRPKNLPKSYATKTPLKVAQRGIEDLSYGQLLQEAEKVTIQHENLKKIYQTNKLGESALRRLLSERSQGHDLKKALNREFKRKRLSPEKLPWHPKKIHTGHISNTSQPSAIPQAAHQYSQATARPQVTQAADVKPKEDSKPDGLSIIKTLAFVIFAVIALILILIFKKNI
jgi:hypothetical protein